MTHEQTLRDRLSQLFDDYQENVRNNSVPALQLSQKLLFDIHDAVMQPDTLERSRIVRLQQLEVLKAQMQDRLNEANNQLHDYYSTITQQNTELQSIYNEKMYYQHDLGDCREKLEQAMIDRNELGLLLAKAWRLRPGSPALIMKQFCARGLRGDLVTRTVSELDFCTEMNRFASTRRVTRLNEAKIASRKNSSPD